MIRFLKILFLFLAFGLLVNNSKAAYNPLLFQNNSWFGNNTFLNGLVANNSTLTGMVYATSFTYAITNVGSANFTITTNNIIYQGFGTNQIGTLPLSPAVSTEFTINCNTNNGSIIITNSNGSQLINGQLSITNTGISSVTLFYDGNNYYPISGNGSILTGIPYTALSGGVSWPTNQNQITPDFTKPVQLMSTNAAFTFLAPVGVDTTKLLMQSCAIYVTNTTASAVLATAPASCHVVGTMYITNLTRFTFEQYGGVFTNIFAVPIF